jgi:hypothetical protein
VTGARYLACRTHTLVCPLNCGVQFDTPARSKHLKSSLCETSRYSFAFREDLYYRLNVVRIAVPPLRERRSDIVPLAEHFLRSHSEKNGLPVVGFSDPAILLLQNYSYPGNVRELENIVERAVLMARGRVLMPEHFAAMMKEKGNHEPHDTDVSHCTSWVRCDTTSLARRRRDSFMPWAFRGGLSPGCSYRQWFLSLQA